MRSYINGPMVLNRSPSMSRKSATSSSRSGWSRRQATAWSLRRRSSATDGAADAPPREAAELPYDQSVGYLLSDTQRLLYRALQARLMPHEVAAGTWHFLRAIWREDGLTQRELSQRVGILEATTGQALENLEKAGCIHRVRNSDDRRKVNVYLTRRGRDLAQELLPMAIELNDLALEGFSPREAAQFREYLDRMRQNLKIGRAHV